VAASGRGSPVPGRTPDDGDGLVEDVLDGVEGDVGDSPAVPGGEQAPGRVVEGLQALFPAVAVGDVSEDDLGGADALEDDRAARLSTVRTSPSNRRKRQESQSADSRSWSTRSTCSARRLRSSGWISVNGSQLYTSAASAALASSTRRSFAYRIAPPSWTRMALGEPSTSVW